MASPQLENGFSPIANELLDAVLLFGFTGTQLHIFLWVVRNTYGWSRKLTRFSWRKVAREINSSPSGAIVEGGRLMKSQVFYVQAGLIGIQKDYELWVRKGERPFFGRPIVSEKRVKMEGAVSSNGKENQVRGDRPSDRMISRVIRHDQPSDHNMTTGVITSDHRSDRGDQPTDQSDQQTDHFSVELNQVVNQKDFTTYGEPDAAPPVFSRNSGAKKDLTPVQQVVLGWKVLSKIPKDDKAWDKVHFARCSKSAKALLDLFGNVDDILDCMEFLYQDFTEKNLTCTIETIVKHSDRYRERLVKGPK